MDLVSSSAEPIQYVFRDGDSDWVVTSVPTVPHGTEAAKLYGDLFDCPLRNINYDSSSIPIGSDTEQRVVDRLQSFADAHKSADKQDVLFHGKFPRMDDELVGWRILLWFIGALRQRSSTGA